MRLSQYVTVAALAAAASPALGSAQDAPAARPGCRGTVSQTSSLTLTRRGGGEPVEIPSYPVIETVQPGSPAQLAGLRSGDMVVLQDGRDLVGNPPTRAPAEGDTVRLVVRRDGAEHPITVVLGRWDPAQESPGVTRTCRPLASG